MTQWLRDAFSKRIRPWHAVVVLVGFHAANVGTQQFRDDPRLLTWISWPFWDWNLWWCMPACFVALAFLRILRQDRRRMGDELSLWLLISVLAAVAAFSFRIGPGWTATSDRHDALIGGWRFLSEGHNPYWYRTFLDNTVSPMVGGLLLASPFVIVMGDLALMGLGWLWILAWGLRRYVSTQASLVVIALMALGPAFRLELAITSDGWVNAAALVVSGSAVWHLAQHAGRRTSRGVAFFVMCVLLSFAIAYRMNYGVIGITLVVALWRAKGLRPALWTAGIAGSLSLAIAIVPFLVNPAIYAPFEKSSMGVSRFYAHWPLAIGVTTMITLGIGTWYARTLRGVWATAAATMTAFIVMVCIGRHQINFYEGWAYSSSAFLYLLVAVVLGDGRRSAPGLRD